MFSVFRFVLFSLATIIVLIPGFVILKGKNHRLFLFAMVGGCWLYSGVGGSYLEVDPAYFIYYFVFIISLVVGFIFSLILFFPVKNVVAMKIDPNADISRSRLGYYTIPFYIGLFVIPLLYPEMKLQRIILPPMPDLVAFFSGSFAEKKTNTLLKLVQYMQLLSEPFFYICLYKYRNKFWKIVLILLALLYLQYIRIAYIGRGSIMIYFVICLLAYWYIRPKHRVKLVIYAIFLFALLFVFFNYYSAIRIGAKISNVSLLPSIQAIIEKEISYPMDVGMSLIRSGARTNLGKYFLYIITLPIPKIFIGQFDIARINVEISEIISGMSRADSGFYIYLPGLVAESVYIYGKWLFWIHGLFLSSIAALVLRIVETSDDFLFLRLYLLCLFGYNLNRAGVGAMLSNIINGLLFFFIYIFLTSFNWKTFKFYLIPRSSFLIDGKTHISGIE